MKSVFKKASAFVLVLSSVAVAAGLISKDEVNQKVAAITAPFNNQNTTISLSFTDLNVSAVRALDFGVEALVAKKGPKNEVVLKIDNLAYHFGNGWSPSMTGNVSLKLDLLKLASQEDINVYAKDFEELAKTISGEMTEKYGEAVTVDAKLADVKRDANGDVESATLRIAASMDFEKLPTGVNAEDVEFKTIAVQLSAGRTGLVGQWKVVMNPLFSRFQADQPGLKEFIERLLGDDQEMFQGIQEMVGILDGMAEWIVNTDRNEQPAPQPEPQP